MYRQGHRQQLHFKCRLKPSEAVFINPGSSRLTHFCSNAVYAQCFSFVCIFDCHHGKCTKDIRGCAVGGNAFHLSVDMAKVCAVVQDAVIQDSLGGGAYIYASHNFLLCNFA